MSYLTRASNNFQLKSTQRGTGIVYGKESLPRTTSLPMEQLVGIFPNDRRKPRTRKQYLGCLCWKMHDGVCTSLNPAGRETNGSLRSICVYEGDEASKYPLFSFFSFFVRGETDSSASPSVFFSFLPLFLSLSLSPCHNYTISPLLPLECLVNYIVSL